MSDAAEHERWRLATDLFERALELPAGDRESWLRGLAGVDEAARVMALRWLAADAASDGFLDTPLARPQDGALPGDLTGTRLGAWRLLRRLGAGGMGEVWLAERADGSFEQQAAIKRLLYPTPELVQRFLHERRVLARLRHPRIAQLYDGGLDAGGVPYFVMEYVEGASLTRHGETHALGLRERLALFVAVCEAVDYAHRHLIVHRDLKPSNILVDGEGHPKLLDFGIAKVLDTESTGEGETETLAQRLTPDYAAPEQLRGERVTTATDVYSLGVVLCELIAGDRPYRLASRRDAVRALHDVTPSLPSTIAAQMGRAPAAWASRLRGDLDRIVQRATAPEPERRYPGALALADDVRRHLDGLPILARGDDAGYRARRFVSRHRVATIAAIAIAAILIGAAALSAVQAHRVEVQRDLYRAEAQRTEAVLDYMASMFRSAPRTADAGPLTAHDLVTRAADELDRHFADRPADLARVVAFVAELFSELTDDAGALPLEQRFLASPAASANPEMTARIRLFYAGNLLHTGDLEHAAEALRLAQAYWSRDREQFRDLLVRGHIVEGQILKARGDTAGAIAFYREALPDAVAAIGADADDTANIENSLGLALMQTGELEEADRHVQHALDVKRALGRSSDDIETAKQNLGAIAYNRGDYLRARHLLGEVVDERRSTYGASGAMAAAELNLGRTLIRSGEPDAALPLLAESQGMAVRFIGEHSPVTIGASQAIVEAQIARHDVRAAENALSAARAQLAAAGGGEKHPLYANERLLEGQLQALEGHRDAAGQLIDDAVVRLQAAGPGSRAALQHAEDVRHSIDGTH